MKEEIKQENQTSGFIPEKVVYRYTPDEFWKSLYYECCDSDGDYDGYLHLVSSLNGSQIKIPIKDIINESAKKQNNK